MSRESPAQEYKGVKALEEEDGADTLEILDEGSHSSFKSLPEIRKRLEGRRVSSWEMKVSVQLQKPATQETSENVSKMRRREKEQTQCLVAQQRQMNTWRLWQGSLPEELSFAAPLALPSSFVRHDLPCKLSVFRDPSSFQMWGETCARNFSPTHQEIVNEPGGRGLGNYLSAVGDTWREEQVRKRQSGGVDQVVGRDGNPDSIMRFQKEIRSQSITPSSRSEMKWMGGQGRRSSTPQPRREGETGSKDNCRLVTHRRLLGVSPCVNFSEGLGERVPIFEFRNKVAGEDRVRHGENEGVEDGEEICHEQCTLNLDVVKKGMVKSLPLQRTSGKEGESSFYSGGANGSSDQQVHVIMEDHIFLSYSFVTADGPVSMWEGTPGFLEGKIGGMRGGKRTSPDSTNSVPHVRGSGREDLLDARGIGGINTKEAGPAAANQFLKVQISHLAQLRRSAAERMASRTEVSPQQRPLLLLGAPE